MNKPCFTAATMLLPDAETSVKTWGCIACDQFTSDPDYWQHADAWVGDEPSALRLVLPEVYLSEPDVAQRVEHIQQTMRAYAQDVLTRVVTGFVYVERTEQSGAVRQGIVGKVDLEAYSYQKGALPAVRPSESTVVDRIPPRLAVRRGAPLETPHVMMLIDDADQSVIEPLAAQKANLPLLYEGDLMLGGGHIAGWSVQDPALVAQIERAVAHLGTREQFDAKYPAAVGAPTLTLAVGDGNHSLATAKAYWEELKGTLTETEQQTHPARYCLCEVCNVHSPAIEIEPIHRVLFGTSFDSVSSALTAFCAEHALGLQLRTAPKTTDAPSAQQFSMLACDVRTEQSINQPQEPLTVGTIDAFIATYLAIHPDVEVDYVHDESAVVALCQKGGVGFLLPPFAKSDIFKGVVLGGVLPRKTFSMGHAEEKRYYIECRKITN